MKSGLRRDTFPHIFKDLSQVPSPVFLSRLRTEGEALLGRVVIKEILTILITTTPILSVELEGVVGNKIKILRSVQPRTTTLTGDFIKQFLS